MLRKKRSVEEEEEGRGRRFGFKLKVVIKEYSLKYNIIDFPHNCKLTSSTSFIIFALSQKVGYYFNMK